MENLKKPDESRRSFLTGVAGAGALAALGEAATLREALAQAAGAPSAPAGNRRPNEAIKAGKVPAMQYHSERPITGSVPAHEQDFEFTPTDRVFIRNNLLTPDLDINTHRLDGQGTGRQGTQLLGRRAAEGVSRGDHGRHDRMRGRGTLELRPQGKRHALGARAAA